MTDNTGKDASGNTDRRDEVVLPGKHSDEGDDSRHVSELAEEAEQTRRQAVGDDKARKTLGGDKASSE